MHELVRTELVEPDLGSEEQLVAEEAAFGDRRPDG